MAFKDLKLHLSKQMVGVQPDRIEIRSQGCWNCIHGDAEKAAKLWWEEARLKLLSQGVAVATQSPLGERDQRVVNIRSMVPKTDAEMTMQKWLCCTGGGIKADGTDVGTFVHTTYLCRKWTAKQGASVAREGAAIDKLPEEAHDRMMNDPPGELFDPPKEN